MAENEKVETIAEQSAPEPKTPQEDPKEKRIKELEEKLGEQGRTIGEQQAIIENARTVAQVIWNNEQLRDQFNKAYEGMYGVSTKQQEEGSGEAKAVESSEPANSRIVEEVNDLKASSREKILADFESRYGIANLPDEERKEVRGKIATELAKFGHRVQTLPLSTLSESLESAYMASHARKLKEEGRLEGIAEVRQNAYGAIPTMPSGKINEAEQQTLSPKAREYAEKLGVDPEKAAKHIGEEVTTVAK